MQRYNIFLKPPNFFINFFLISCKSLTFCDKHHSFHLMPHFSTTLSASNRHTAIKYSIRTTYKERKRRATHHYELPSEYLLHQFNDLRSLMSFAKNSRHVISSMCKCTPNRTPHYQQELQYVLFGQVHHH